VAADQQPALGCWLVAVLWAAVVGTDERPVVQTVALAPMPADAHCQPRAGVLAAKASTRRLAPPNRTRWSQATAST
jgi:hypothetical protein